VSDGDDSLETLFGRAADARAAGAPAEGVLYLRQAAERYPGAALAHVMLAYALIDLGRAEEAAAAATDACRLAPDAAAAHRALGRAQRLADQPEAALAALDRALSLKPFDADAHYERALLLAQLKRRDDAALALKAGLVCAPKHEGLKRLARRLGG